MVDLKELPEDHVLRNTPLREIGAEVKNNMMKSWRCVQAWKIGRSSYNQLEDDPWKLYNEWRAEDSL
jgi:hypothetical protein